MSRQVLEEVRALLIEVASSQSQGAHESVQQGIQDAIELLDQVRQAPSDAEVSGVWELVLDIVKAIPALQSLIERFMSGC